ncbi:MAG: hypothetical protein WCJ07_08490 [Verrucomicrobiota bacterium]
MKTENELTEISNALTEFDKMVESNLQPALKALEPLFANHADAIRRVNNRHAPDFLLVTQPPESWPAAFWKQDFEQLIAAHGLIHVVLRFVQFFGTLIYVKRRCFHIKGGSPTFGKPQNEKLPVNTGSLCAFDAK